LPVGNTASIPAHTFDTISATGNRHQLLSDMWTMTPKVRLARKNNTRSSFDRAGEFFTENN